jgi:hypothetical protein
MAVGQVTIDRVKMSMELERAGGGGWRRAARQSLPVGLVEEEAVERFDHPHCYCSIGLLYKEYSSHDSKNLYSTPTALALLLLYI